MIMFYLREGRHSFSENQNNKMRKIIPYLCLNIIFIVSGCSTTNSGFRKPDLDKVNMGMTKPEVIEVLGKPDNVSSQGGYEYMEYGWDIFMDGKVGNADTFYVRLINGRVESYGRKGDFDSTKNKAVDININQNLTSDIVKKTQKNDSSVDLFTNLKKLQALKKEGLLTEGEFNNLRKKAIEKAK